MPVENSPKQANYLAGGVKTPGTRFGPLPPHVRAKKAKGKIYYYFETGIKNEGGRQELTRLPHKDELAFAEAVAQATLERWQRIQPRFTRREVIVEDAKGDYLYFARCQDAVKIGRARNIPARMVNMQVSSPHEIDCICSLTGRGHEEDKWHAMFAEDRIRGEWFRWTPRLARAIDDARQGKKPWLGPTPNTSPKGSSDD